MVQRRKIMRILIIEDDVDVAAYTSQGLREHGHTVDIATNGKDGLFLAMNETEYDVLIVDRMLPQLDGLSMIKALRGAGKMTPALILSAMGEIDDRVTGLRSGGDDYLVKPFAFSELLARLEILSRRSSQDPDAVVTKLIAQDLEMDILARQVKRNGKPIELQSREFRLLEYMLKHKGQVVTRTMLLESVWDYHFDPQTNVIDVHISRLRNKIDGDGDMPLIRTVRGAGYIIDDKR